MKKRLVSIIPIVFIFMLPGDLTLGKNANPHINPVILPPACPVISVVPGLLIDIVKLSKIMRTTVKIKIHLVYSNC